LVIVVIVGWCRGTLVVVGIVGSNLGRELGFDPFIEGCLSRGSMHLLVCSVGCLVGVYLVSFCRVLVGVTGFQIG